MKATTTEPDERDTLVHAAVKTARDVDVAVLVDISVPSVEAAANAADQQQVGRRRACHGAAVVTIVRYDNLFVGAGCNR